MNTEDRLKEAIEDGEVLKIIYHGGSQPGTSRYIAPIQVGNGKVRARCYSSKDVKVFYLNNLPLWMEMKIRNSKSIHGIQS
jgi:predicted DNA-binding transcriptional regulator YafY